MDYKDYYKILGLPRTASQADVKKAFRKLAREHHPDLKPDDKAAERRFKDINEANAVLSDPAKRKQYDTLGADWESYARAGGGADPFGPDGPFAGFSRAGGAGGGNVRYEFRSSGDTAGFSDFPTFSAAPRPARRGRRRAAGLAGPRGQAADGQSLEDMLAGMGRGCRPAPSTGRPPRAAEALTRYDRRPRSRRAAAEAPRNHAQEAFHGDPPRRGTTAE